MGFRKHNIDEMINVINSHAKFSGREIETKVLEVMREVPRHLFVRVDPYADSPQLIGWKQTISQPFVVAYMTDILDVQSSHKVLDIGMGSGYQSAILSKLSKEVYAVEIIKELAEKTKKVLTDYKNIKIRIGDGYEGWAEYAPYDRIMVAAKVNKIPKKLLNQLVDGGKMIIPLVTEKREKLVLVTKTNTSYKQESLIGVRFVPLVEKE